MPIFPLRGGLMACGKQPVSCREQDIARRYDLAPNKRKTWQFEGRCPVCGHGGFSITAGDQGFNPLRHIWWCNCHRCRCDPAIIRKAMLADGISEDCLGSYKRNGQPEQPRDDEAARMREALRGVLAAPDIGSLSELRLRVLEVIEGDAPEDWRGFLEFAERAGVPRSKRYDAAARWGRRQPK